VDESFDYLTGDDGAGAYEIMVVVSDPWGGEDSHSWNLSVIHVNQAPVITSWNPLIDVTISESESKTFSVSASDPDGDPITYKWFLDGSEIDGLTVNTYEFTTTYNDSRVNPYVIKVEVSDGELTVDRVWNVTVEETNRPPKILSQAPTSPVTMAENTTRNFSVTYIDEDGDTVTFTWLLDGNVLLGKDKSELAWYANFSSAGDHTLSVRIRDVNQGQTTAVWTVTVTNTNQPPTITGRTPSGDPTVGEGLMQNFTVTAKDNDPGDSLSYSWKVDGTVQAGETLNKFTWIPNYDDAGQHTVTAIVSDSQSATNQTSWKVTVLNINRPPVAVANVDFPNAGIGVDVTFDATGSADPDNDMLTYIWNFGDGSPTLGGKSVQHSYTVPGIYKAEVTVAEASGPLSDKANISVTINLTQDWASSDLGQITLLLVDDVDGDSTKEIVVGTTDSKDGAGTYTGYIYIYDGSNYNEEYKSPNIGKITAIAIDNVDTDPSLEVIVGTLEDVDVAGAAETYHGYVYVYDGNTHTEEYKSPDIGKVTEIRTGDVDGDTIKEIVAAHSDVSGPSGTNYMFWGNLSVYGWDGANIAQEWVSSSSISSVRAMELSDMDGDGKLDIVGGTWDYLDLGGGGGQYGTVFIAKESGGSFTFPEVNLNMEWVTALKIANIDGAAGKEIVVGTYAGDQADHYEGYLYVLDNTTVQDWKGATDYGYITDIELNDWDGDSTTEIIFGVNYFETEDTGNPNIKYPEGYLYILAGTGTHTQEFKSSEIGAVMDLTLGDFHADSKMEIAVGTWEKIDQNGNTEGYAYLFYYNTGQGQTQELWKSPNLGAVGVDYNSHGGFDSMAISDVDGQDGVDLVFGVTTKNTDVDWSGKVYVYANKLGT
jgi:hypothetical protein